jgi:hypothetical protein
VLTALASATNVTITTTTLPNGTVQMPYSRTVRFSHNWFQFVCQQAERFVLAEHNGPKVRVSRSNAKCGLNPSAARSLEEGMEETLTVHRLRVPAQLRRTLASTNVIESAFSIVETVCRNVKRWRAGDHIERWVGSGLLVAERQFRTARFPRC